MADAALALHDATFEQHYLNDAQRWSVHLQQHYLSGTLNLLGMTLMENKGLPVIPRPTHDDAVPNANGIHANNLLRLAIKSGDLEDRDRADAFLSVALAAAERAPMAHGSILNAYDLARHGVEIVLAGSERAALHQAALALPYTVTTLVDCPDASSLPAEHPAAAMARQAGKGAAFICFAGRCLPPVTEPNRLAQAVAEGR
jgi:uncharacterized protein YyaL (SSP411 family)